MNDKKKVLFSPIGTTDPIRNGYDGACLHIVRYYRPQKVVLYLTTQMEEYEDKDNRFTKAIHSVDKDIEIKLIRSGVDGGYNYDDLYPGLVDAIRAEEQDDTELILNISSGTTQIKNIMAIWSVEDSLKAVQVTTPAKGSNVNVPHLDKNADIDTVISNNLDDLDDAENRCVEPKLYAIRYHAEKLRLLSLISKYEYTGAWELARTSDIVSDKAKALIEHASYRYKLQTKAAKRVLTVFDGVALFPFSDKELDFAEYFLILQQDRQKGKLNETLVKMNNLLFEAMKYFLEKRYNIGKYMVERRILKRSKLAENDELIAAFDNEYVGGFKDSDLSFRNELVFCRFFVKTGKADENLAAITESLEKLSKLSNNRNVAAHTITNFDEDEFTKFMGLSSIDAVNEVAKVMLIILGDAFKKYRGMYNSLNKWIEQNLED